MKTRSKFFAFTVDFKLLIDHALGLQALCAWMLTNADRVRTSAALTRPAATRWAASPAPAFLPLWASRPPSPVQVGAIYRTYTVRDYAEDRSLTLMYRYLYILDRTVKTRD